MAKNYNSLLEGFEKDMLNIVDAFADYMGYSVVPRSIKKISVGLYKINNDFYNLDDIRDILEMKIPPQIVSDWYEYRKAGEGIMYSECLVMYFKIYEMMDDYSGYESVIRYIYKDTSAYAHMQSQKALKNLWNEIKKSVVNICNSIRKRYNKFVKKS